MRAARVEAPNKEIDLYFWLFGCIYTSEPVEYRQVQAGI